MEKKIYTSPEVEVIEVAIEQGFAASNTDEFDGEWGPINF